MAMSSPSKARASGEHLVEHAAERPDIRASVDRLARPAPASCRPPCPDHPRLVIAGVVIVGDLRDLAPQRCGTEVPPYGCRLQRLRQSEVQHLHRAVGAHLDVRGLEIAMNDPLLVGGLQGFGDLPRDRQRVVERERPAGDRRASRRPRRVPSRARCLRGSPRRRLRDVGMVQRREHLRLALKRASRSGSLAKTPAAS